MHSMEHDLGGGGDNSKVVDEPHAKRQEQPQNSHKTANLSMASRCRAKTRKGGLCMSPGMRNGRCRMHGGASTGPRTPEGLERSRKSRLVHGAYSKEDKELKRMISKWCKSNFIEET